MINFWENKNYPSACIYSVKGLRSFLGYGYIVACSPSHASICIKIEDVRIDVNFLNKGFVI